MDMAAKTVESSSAVPWAHTQTKVANAAREGAKKKMASVSARMSPAQASEARSSSRAAEMHLMKGSSHTKALTDWMPAKTSATSRTRLSVMRAVRWRALPTCRPHQIWNGMTPTVVMHPTRAACHPT